MTPLIESAPGEQLTEVWAYLSPQEALELRDALNAWATDQSDPEWHCHVADADGNELTIAIERS